MVMVRLKGLVATVLSLYVILDRVLSKVVDIVDGDVDRKQMWRAP
jgi:hypothetical protein